MLLKHVKQQLARYFETSAGFYRTARRYTQKISRSYETSANFYKTTPQKIVRSSETSAGFYRTAQRYYPEHRTFLRNDGGLLPNYMALHHRRSYVLLKRRQSSTEVHGDIPSHRCPTVALSAFLSHNAQQFEIQENGLSRFFRYGPLVT
jgi:hypothetical protein